MGFKGHGVVSPVASLVCAVFPVYVRSACLLGGSGLSGGAMGVVDALSITRVARYLVVRSVSLGIKSNLRPIMTWLDGSSLGGNVRSGTGVIGGSVFVGITGVLGITVISSPPRGSGPSGAGARQSGNPYRPILRMALGWGPVPSLHLLALRIGLPGSWRCVGIRVLRALSNGVILAK